VKPKLVTEFSRLLVWHCRRASSTLWIGVE